MEYINLSKFEKFEVFKETNFWGVERSVAAKYLKAIWLNDIETINFFESFGKVPHKIIYNYRQYERRLMYGFEDIVYDEHGWIERPTLLEKEEIDIFKLKDSWINHNHISIGRGKKENSWTYGYGSQNNTSGSHCGACIWGEMVATKELAIEKACLKIIDFHTKHQSSISSKVIQLAKDKIDIVKGIKGIQLSFF